MNSNMKMYYLLNMMIKLTNSGHFLFTIDSS